MSLFSSASSARLQPEATWLSLGRAAFAVIVVTMLMGLGVANIAMRFGWHSIEDGVLWGDRPEGVVAIEVAQGSAGEAAGIHQNDVLVAINGSPVEQRNDVLGVQRRSRQGTRLAYTLLRLNERQRLDVELTDAVASEGSLYYLLAAVGLFTLFVGASVRLRRPHDQATLHFFWLCVAFFGTFTFSFNGPFNRLDWVFYWGDAIATALLPPLLLHFAMGFPARDDDHERSWEPVVLPFIYLPGLALIATRIFVVRRGAQNGQLFSSMNDLLNRAEPIYLFLCAIVAVGVLVKAFSSVTSLTGRRQLRWMAWGTILGGGPFALGYALPWSLGIDPPVALQLTAVPLGLMPMAFASAIVRYRLRDVEVIVKRCVVYTTFLAASAVLYLAFRYLVDWVYADSSDPHNWVVALLATLVVVLIAQPVKDALTDILDRAFYRDRYDYRRALVAFARDLNADLDVVRLSQRLVSRIVETLALDRMSLMLADERLASFKSIDDFGFPGAVPSLTRKSSFMTRLDAGHIIALDGSDPIAAARFAAEDVEFWRDQGVTYFVPCIFEGLAIAVLALGRDDFDEPFNSEDLALLTAVAGQVATAIENGRLYRQLHLKAEELGRMREFNENILESLDDGLAVIDGSDHIVRWNHALENFYGVKRDEAIGRVLDDVFDQPFVEALRAALGDHPRGTTLFRVPLIGRKPQSGAKDSEPSRLLVNATAVPLKNPDDETETGTILLLEDVTARVRLEEQLQISEKMASIGLLAAGVAHEVNTPLTGISSFTQMLLDGADPKDPKTTILEKIERQTFRAAKIVNGLLTLSRPGTQGAERTHVDLNEIVNDVFSLLEHQFEVGKLKIRRELSAEPVMVVGIEHQLQQVFLNLFLNARDAMPRGGWLTVTTKANGTFVVAEVADTGSGIPPEQLARIYDPFFTTKVIGRGTGLGLSITYGIVHEHGGSIRCDSTVGQGTRFTLSLPIAQSVVRSVAN